MNFSTTSNRRQADQTLALLQEVEGWPAGWNDESLVTEIQHALAQGLDVPTACAIYGRDLVARAQAA